MRNIWDEILGQEAGATNKSNILGIGGSIEQILVMRLSKFSNSNIAVMIYSEILDFELWLCANDFMEYQIKEDEPEAVIYSEVELRELIRLNPDPEGIRTIHNAKTVFEGSKVVSVKSKKHTGV